jgi:hypothetical protein
VIPVVVGSSPISHPIVLKAKLTTRAVVFLCPSPALPANPRTNYMHILLHCAKAGHLPAHN